MDEGIAVVDSDVDFDGEVAVVVEDSGVVGEKKVLVGIVVVETELSV